MTATGWPLVAFQKRTVRSKPVETISRLLALNATELTGPVCPVRLNSSLFSRLFHTLTVPSLQPPAIILPSGLRAMLLTASFDASDRSAFAVGKSHTLAVLSTPPDASIEPSGD